MKRIFETHFQKTPYIVFENRASVDIAVAKLNMMVFEGRHMRVDRCVSSLSLSTASGKSQRNIDKAAVHYDHTRSVFIGNLPFDVEDEEIYMMFAGALAKTNNISSKSMTASPTNGNDSKKQILLLNNSCIPQACLDQLEAVRVVRDRDTNIGKGNKRKKVFMYDDSSNLSLSRLNSLI